MKKLFVCAIAIATLMSGCGTGAVDLDELATNEPEAQSGSEAQEVSTEAEAETAVPDDDEAREITLEFVGTTPEFFENAAQEFEEQTGVKVNLTYHDYSEAEATMERIHAKLMAGKGADIYAGFPLNFQTLGQQNHLCDMATWIAQNADFTSEKYYMRVIEEHEVDNHIYGLPLFFLCNGLGTKVDVPELEADKQLTWEQFFDITKIINRNGVLYSLTDYELFERRYKESAGRYIDEQNNTHDLNSTEMIELLEQCKSWGEENICIPYSLSDQPEAYDSAFFKEYGTGILALAHVCVERKDNGEPEIYWFDIPADDEDNNNANMIFGVENVCINEACSDKETAWQFIKFLLGEQMQANNQWATPVLRSVAETSIEKEIEMIELYGLDFDTQQIKDDILYILNNIGRITSRRSSVIETIILEEAQRYFADEVSAEAAAQNMAKKVELFFKEQ